MKKIILIILTIFLLFSCNKKELEFDTFTTNNEYQVNDLSIMSFNIQILGKTKSAKSNVMETIIDIIDDYDIIAIQEIRDASDITLTTLNEMLPDYYKIVVGPREGRSSSKEQAIYIYDDRILNVIWQESYNDLYDVFERSPFLVYFEDEERKISFIMMNIHVSPSKAKSEIKHLSSLMIEIETSYEKDVILLGDLNADGNYYNEDNLDEIFPEKQYKIIIGNEWNTTVSTKDNTYDRIIITNELDAIIRDHGVFYFQDSLIGDIKLEEVSDHYPVYMILEY